MYGKYATGEPENGLYFFFIQQRL